LLRGGERGEDQDGEEEEVRARSHRRHAVVGRRGGGVEERKCGGGEVGFKARWRIDLQALQRYCLVEAGWVACGVLTWSGRMRCGFC
jgi:hypothetical protein